MYSLKVSPETNFEISQVITKILVKIVHFVIFNVHKNYCDNKINIINGKYILD